MAESWKFYYPDDGEDADDARALSANELVSNDAYWAAKAACEYDYTERDGWESVGEDFKIVIITPDGNEVLFNGMHEPTIEHTVSEA